MSELLQDFSHDHHQEFFENYFWIKSLPENLSPQELFFIQSENQQEQFREAQITFQYHKNQANSQKLEEKVQETNREKEVVINLKRKPKPSKYNQSMGFIPESAKVEKKKYIRKKKPVQHAFQHPTKNFLQNFKGAHFEYLQARLTPNQLSKISLFRQLKQKVGISMQDYQQLYSIPEFEEAFDSMFRSRYLYRSMMLSRSQHKSRIHHLRKLPLFEQSFRTKVFERIN